MKINRELIKDIYGNSDLFAGKDIRKNLVILTLLGLLAFASEASFILVLQGFFRSTGLVAGSQLFLPAWYPQGVAGSLLFLMLFGVFRMLSGILKTFYATKVQFAFIFQQRKNLFKLAFKHTHLLPFKEIVSLFGETVTYAGVAIYSASTIIGIVLTSIFFVALGFRLAPYEMLMGLVLLGSIYFPIKKFTSKTNQISKGINVEWNSLNDILLRGLKNNFFINVYNQVDNEIDKGRSGLKKYIDHYEKYSLIASFNSSLPVFLGIVIICILSMMSIAYFHTEAMKLISFFYIFIRLSQSASELSSTISNVRINLPRLISLYKITNQINDLEKKSGVKLIFPECNEISLRIENLSFQYEGGKFLFKDLNCSVSKGTVLLIKGESGSGKSTLLSVILGLNKPTTGRVLLNDCVISENRYNFQGHLAYVGPEPFLIQGTVWDNLLYGYEGSEITDKQKIWDVLEIVELVPLIKSLPLGLAEPMADIPSMSTGQKQRLSLARALLRDPKLLILDEATANLDLETEKKIIANLTSIFNKCAVVIVSHKNTFDDIASNTLNL